MDYQFYWEYSKWVVTNILPLWINLILFVNSIGRMYRSVQLLDKGE